MHIAVHEGIQVGGQLLHDSPAAAVELEDLSQGIDAQLPHAHVRIVAQRHQRRQHLLVHLHPDKDAGRDGTETLFAVKTTMAYFPRPLALASGL